MTHLHLLQLTYESFQDTADKLMDSDYETLDMFEYLKGNSTGLETSGNYLINSNIFLNAKLT